MNDERPDPIAPVDDLKSALELETDLAAVRRKALSA